jgi:hypothetical protein
MSLFGSLFLQMSDFKAEVNGITYICKSDCTALAERGSGDLSKVLVFRGFIELNGNRYVLKKMNKYGFAEWVIESIGIPSNLEVIRERCFSCCKSFSEFIFESGSKLKEIGKSAFYECGIKSVQIPNNVEIIGEECFWGCKSLCEVRFESRSQLRKIGICAFRKTGVDMIESPARCEHLTGLSLYRLKLVTISKGNKSFILRSDFVMNMSGTVLIRYFGGDERVLIKRCVESISSQCFSSCQSLCEITFELGSKLKEIGRSAFHRSAIKSIRIPSNAEVIGEDCFSSCISLSEVTFESGSQLKEIGESAFPQCAIKSIRIPSNVEVIGLQSLERTVFHIVNLFVKLHLNPILS